MEITFHVGTIGLNMDFLRDIVLAKRNSQEH